MVNRRRGRPAFEEEAAMIPVAAIYPDVRSKRGRQNIVYQTRAIIAIEEMDRREVTRFFVDDEKNIMRCSMLAEIGRLKSPALMREMAMQVYQCYIDKGDMKTKEWAAVIRRCRIEWMK